MDNNPPPPYEAFNNDGKSTPKWRANIEQDQWSLRDQVDNSRFWHISVAAEKIHTVLERRAMCGISKTRLVLVPSGQRCGRRPLKTLESITSDRFADLPKEYSVAEYADVEKPAVVELTGEADTIEFWSQPVAVEDLRKRISMKVGGRGSGMARVNARLDDVHIRSETVFGLLETTLVRVIVVEVE